MPTTFSTFWAGAGFVAMLLPLGACGFDMTAHSGKGAAVDIHTRAGDMSVHSDVDRLDTGLPAYPGSVPTQARDGRENADVNIDTKWFGVKVAAAKFESSDAPQNVVDFYESRMAAYGSVTECRGKVDFTGRKGEKRPVCREGWPSTNIVELLTGTEERQRIVVVKPKGNGTEFSVVYVQTRGGN